MASKYDKNTTGSQLVNDLRTSITGKVVLVTGTSPGGIGAFYCTAVANAKPSILILAGRVLKTIQETADQIKAENPNVAIKTLVIDLASLESVRKAAAEVNGWVDVPYIDVLVNNAGIMAVPYTKTVDGFERQFATNHLGPFLFTNLILGKVLASAHKRVVMVSSGGHRYNSVRFGDYGFADGKNYNKWWAYGQAKTAVCLTAIYLAKKLGGRGLQVYSLHPGVTSTNLVREWNPEEDMPGMIAAEIQCGSRFVEKEKLTWCTPETIIANHILASFSDDFKDHNGAYLYEGHVANQYEDEVMPWATNEIEADKTWKLSEKLVGQEFAY